ncbi:MAG: hypothetical protein AB1486_25805 [Planctomycetota bacterium]
MKPVFLGLDEVLEIHRDQIDRYGGRGGILDLGLLQSALAMPEAGARHSLFLRDFSAICRADSIMLPICVGPTGPSGVIADC